MTKVTRAKSISAEQKKALVKVGCKTPADAGEKLQKHYREIKAELSKLGTEINQGFDNDVVKQSKKTQKMFDAIPDSVKAAW